MTLSRSRRGGGRRNRCAALATAFLVAAAAPVGGASAAETITVSRVSVDDAKEVLATVESARTPQARARLGGTLVSLSVTEGDRVGRGDVLALVEDPKLRLQRVAAAARIAALEGKLTQVVTELDRARRLRATGSVSQARLDDAETQMIVLRAEIAAARADESVMAEQVTEGRVLAPDDGRVLRVSAVAGQVVMPGEPIVTLATSRYLLKLRLPERHARFMHEGDEVRVADRGLGRGARTGARVGRIVRVYPELDQGRVVADADAEGIGDYFVGERVSVFVATGKRETIVLPEDVLVQREGLTFVRLEGMGEVPVQTGLRHPAIGDAAAGTPQGIEILSGLRPGDRVVRP